jgi:hypothetical protein
MRRPVHRSRFGWTNGEAVAAPVESLDSRAFIPRKAAWFYHLELALLAEGGYHLSIAATTVDEEEPQLLYQELLDERVATIDDLLIRLKLILISSV